MKLMLSVVVRMYFSVNVAYVVCCLVVPWVGTTPLMGVSHWLYMLNYNLFIFIHIIILPFSGWNLNELDPREPLSSFILLNSFSGLLVHCGV